MLTVRDSRFFIPAGSVDAANHLFHAGEEGGIFGRDTLAESFSNLGWELRFDVNGNVVGIAVGTDPEAALADRWAFEAIAPVVRSGSYIEIEIDSTIIRWEFHRKRLVAAP
jgi:hypothetical protein